MKLTLDQLVKQITEFWKSKSKKFKIIVAASAAAVLTLSIVLAVALNRNGYAELYSGLSADEASEISVRLHDMGVESKMSTDGTILVPADQEAELRMTLASEGYPQSTLDYSIFKDNTGFMTTDYEKQKYMLFQLQNRIQDSIKTLTPVKDAIVTISLPENDSFVLKEDEVPATASVVLSLEKGAKLESRQVLGIETLVARSVSDLDPSNVAIVDNSGNVLKDEDENANEETSAGKLEIEAKINKNIEQKIGELLTPVFGSDAVKVAVNASVDIHKKVSEETTYTPVVDNNGIVSKQTSSKESTGSTTGAGNGGVAGEDSNTGVTTYQQEDNTSKTDTGSKESTDTDYLVNQLTEQTERNGYEIKDISVAVLVNAKELSAEQIQTYTHMVAYSAGVADDKVAFSYARFLSDEGDTLSDMEAQDVNNSQLVAFAAIAVALSLLFLVILVLVISGRRRRQIRNEIAVEQPAEENEGKEDKKDKDKKAGQAEIAESEPPKQLKPPEDEITISEIKLNESKEEKLKKQIREFVGGNPEVVAQLIRTWLKEDNDDE